MKSLAIFTESAILKVWLGSEYAFDVIRNIVLENLFSRSRIPPIIWRLNSRSLWSYFEWSIIRNFLEGPTLSIGPFQKVQCEVIYFHYEVKKWKVARNWINIVAYSLKNRETSRPYNFWTPAKSNILDVWNWNCWTLFSLEIEVGGGGGRGGMAIKCTMELFCANS